MYFLYLDESGCTGRLPNATAPIQPVFVLGGIILDQSRLRPFTNEYLYLKQRFFPGLLAPGSQYLNWILKEIKGADVRRELRGTRSEKRHAIGFLDHLIGLLETHDAKIIGRVWVKGIGGRFRGRSIYTYSVQTCFDHFEKFLDAIDGQGVAVADFRFRDKNAVVSHSVFTQKFKATGDKYPHILEMPVFGHSNNHAGIQVCDGLCSALLFPMAVWSYCYGHVHNLHVHMEYSLLKRHFGTRLSHLQYRYQKPNGQWAGGITVTDAISGQSGAVLFR